MQPSHFSFCVAEKPGLREGFTRGRPGALRLSAPSVVAAVDLERTTGELCSLGRACLPTARSTQPATPPGTSATPPSGPTSTKRSVTRSRNVRSWLTTNSAPGQSSKKSSRARRASRSRSLVGSSRNRTLGLDAVESSWIYNGVFHLRTMSPRGRRIGRRRKGTVSSG